MRLSCEVDQRLVDEAELAAAQRHLEALFEHAAVLQRLVHALFEEVVVAAALVLGAIEREVGVLEQRLGVAAVGRRDGDADAGADHDLMAVDDRSASAIDLTIRSATTAASRGSVERRRAARRTRRRRAAPRCRSRARAARSRSATATQHASPTPWPSVSLTALKWSRSRQRTATISSRLMRASSLAPSPRGRQRGWAGRSARRGGRGGWTRASFWRCSVMSSWVATQPPSAIGW